MRKSVSLFNPGVSNIGSFERFLSDNDISSVFVNVGDSIDTETLIICGVSGLSLNDQNYILNFKNWVSDLLNNSKVRIIGICAGMQLFFTYTDESSENLLGLLKGNVVKLDFNPVRTNTFIGFRDLKLPDTGSIARAYFSHGYGITDFSIDAFNYYIKVDLSSNQSFLAYFEHKNLIGFQFHPERSSEGWRNFLISKIN